MSKELDALQRLYLTSNTKLPYCKNGECLKDYETIEQALKQAEENEKMLNIFKNALTLETKQNVALLDHSEDIFGYSIRTLTEIKQNELNNELKKELREWVLKNAFPKELEALLIMKEHKLLNYIFKNEKCASMYHLPKEKQDLLKEVLL